MPSLAIVSQSHNAAGCESGIHPVLFHQISGPKAKEIIEKVIGDNISDVKFMDFRPIRIPGIAAELEIARIGMSGTIAYEIHGHMQYCAQSYDAVYQAGKEFGIKRLGWRTYCVNHAEGNVGSIAPEDLEARYRTPYDVGWGG